MKDLTPEPQSPLEASCNATIDVVGVNEKTGAEAPVFTFKPVEVTD